MKRPPHPNIWIGSRPITAKGKEPIVALGGFRGIDPLKELLNVGLMKKIGDRFEKGGRGWVLVDINVGYIEVPCCKLIITHSLFEPEVNLRETKDDWKGNDDYENLDERTMRRRRHDEWKSTNTISYSAKSTYSIAG